MPDTQDEARAGESASTPGESRSELHEHHRRTYQTLIVLAVLLAVIGSPLFMQGFVGFVTAVSSGAVGTSESMLRSIARLAISVSPLAIAGFTWHRARALERILEEEDRSKYGQTR